MHNANQDASFLKLPSLWEPKSPLELVPLAAGEFSVLILIFVFFWAEYLSKLQINPVIRDRLFDFKLETFNWLVQVRGKVEEGCFQFDSSF